MERHIAVISDIHSNFSALYAVYADLINCSDEVWFLGDLFGGGGNIAQVYSMLHDLIKPSIWLLGNHDMAALGNQKLYLQMRQDDREKTDEERACLDPRIKKDLSRIDVKKSLKYNGQCIFLSHAVPANKREESVIFYDHRVVLESTLDEDNAILKKRKKIKPKSTIWLMGHSHKQLAWWFHEGKWKQIIPNFGFRLDGIPFVDVNHGEQRSASIPYDQIFEEDLIILNPGSVGKPRDGNSDDHHHIAKYMLLHFDDKELCIDFRFVPYS